MCPPADQSPEFTQLIKGIVELLGIARTPPVFHLAFYLVNDFLLLFEEFFSFIGDGVYLLAVTLRRADLTHVIQHLEGGVNATGARRVKAMKEVFQGAYYFVAMARLVF